MKIVLITPALPRSRSGNRATATRWKNILTELGHRVDVRVDFAGGRYDAMVALHAWRSAASIRRFHTQFPERPLIVALTGTDIYKFIRSSPQSTLYSIRAADRLVTLHELAGLAIPEEYRDKVSVIHQSAKPVMRKPARRKNSFNVCVIGHLREEKDPLRAAYAARRLPAESRIRIRQYGKAHTPVWAERAEQEMRGNPRYRWFGEVPNWQVRRVYAGADVMVLSSRMEGGANVISEACVAGLPVIASEIAGSVGLLGEGYPGYYATGDTRALRELLLRAEADHAWLGKLQAACQGKAGLFSYAREKSRWRTLMNRVA
ncbi:MAG: TIGR04348 family glycosyltransferase [Proteobacteria bacterium]|nr:TIGR04348 family glycosyltransferase [Pseudomonadota bacterium]